jgi:hypothetical protein
LYNTTVSIDPILNNQSNNQTSLFNKYHDLKDNEFNINAEIEPLKKLNQQLLSNLTLKNIDTVLEHLTNVKTKAEKIMNNAKKIYNDQVKKFPVNVDNSVINKVDNETEQTEKIKVDNYSPKFLQARFSIINTKLQIKTQTDTERL